MIASMREFGEYFDGVRRRSIGFFRVIPPERIDWTPKAGEYTCGDIVRHLATCETMFSGVVADGVWRYDGHDRALGASRDEALALLEARHAAAQRALAAVGDAALAELRPALEPGGRPIRGWRVLMAMCEHEVHHRSQLASYLTQMGIDAPDIFGLGVEDVERLATADPAGALATADSASAAPAASLRPPTAEGDAKLRYSSASAMAPTADPTSGAPPISLRPPTTRGGHSAPIQRRSE